MHEWEVLGAKCGQCGHIGWLDRRKVTGRFGNLYLSAVAPSCDAGAEIERGTRFW